MSTAGDRLGDTARKSRARCVRFEAVIRQRLTLVGLALVLLYGTAAESQTLTDGRTWWNVTLAGQPQPGAWRPYLELQGRMRDGAEDLDQLLVRPAAIYDVTNRSSVWFGLGYTPSFPNARGEITEHRFWQQYLWNGTLAGRPFAYRVRFEQRSIDGAGSIAFRLRQQLRVARPLGRTSIQIIAWDEAFLHLNDTAHTAAGFDQNRLFVGLGFPLRPAARIEAGYMNQFIDTIAPASRLHHILSGVLNVTF